MHVIFYVDGVNMASSESGIQFPSKQRGPSGECGGYLETTADLYTGQQHIF
jgi:hypothetical protein